MCNKILFLVLFSMIMPATGAFSRVLIVDKQAAKSEVVYHCIEDALMEAVSGDEILIHEGIYEEKALMVPDGVSLKGLGSVIIQGELPPDISNRELESTSTIDLFQNGRLENLTVTAKNMCYPVHSDFSKGNTIQEIINCNFIHYGNHEVYQYRVTNKSKTAEEVMLAQSAWGGGTMAGDKRFFRGCYFESPLRAFSTHNNVDFDKSFGPSLTVLMDCEMVSHGLNIDGTSLGFNAPVVIQSLQSNSPDKVILTDCRINGYLCFQGASTFEVYCNTPGLKTIYNTAGGSKQIKDQLSVISTNPVFHISNPTQIKPFTNRGTTAIGKGKAVKKEDKGISLMTSKDNDKLFQGVALEEIRPGQKGDVQHCGYLLRPYFSGLSEPLKKGTRIGIDETGSFIIDNESGIAIASDNQNILLTEIEEPNTNTKK